MDVDHLDDASRQERRWGAGVEERCGNDKRILIGGGSTKEVPRQIQKQFLQEEQEGLDSC